ncbi:hypothetical protein MKX03_023778 [Papaver bracteatum]|nr:hypothetical protein MKX03_023778 [Papaver bracteatum]
MSEKICEVSRRSQRLFNNDYNFIEESVCASSGGFVPGPAESRESMDSGSSNDDLGLENDRFEDISLGGLPSPFRNLNATHVPLGREAMRGNDFSNTVFIDNRSSSDDNIFVSNSNLFPPVSEIRDPTK